MGDELASALPSFVAVVAPNESFVEWMVPGQYEFRAPVTGTYKLTELRGGEVATRDLHLAKGLSIMIRVGPRTSPPYPSGS